MLDFLMFAGIIGVFCLSFAGCAAVVLWAFKPQHSCNHRFDRVDDYNDKCFILVCSKCGKIKKLKK